MSDLYDLTPSDFFARLTVADASPAPVVSSLIWVTDIGPAVRSSRRNSIPSARGRFALGRAFTFTILSGTRLRYCDLDHSIVEMIVRSRKPPAQPQNCERVPTTATRSGDATQVELVRGLVGRHARQLGQYRAQLLGSLPHLVSIAERLCIGAAELHAPGLGGPQRQPRALADNAPAKAANKCSRNGSVSAPSSTVMNGTLWTIKLDTKLTSRLRRSSFATMTGLAWITPPKGKRRWLKWLIKLSLEL